MFVGLLRRLWVTCGLLQKRCSDVDVDFLWLPRYLGRYLSWRAIGVKIFILISSSTLLQNELELKYPSRSCPVAMSARLLTCQIYPV